MADDWEDEEDDWETAEAAPLPVVTGGVKKLDEEEEEEEPETPDINPNSKYAGMGIADLVKELERRDTEAAKANAGPKLLSAKERRKKQKEKEEAERERRRKEELMTAEEQEETAAEAYARKMEQQRLVEDADLEIAMELMGGVDAEKAADEAPTEVTLIEAMAPKTEEDFQAFGAAFVTKATKYEKSIHYVQFVSDLIRDLCAELKAEEVKKVSAALNVVLNEKNKAMQDKSKKKKSKGGKLGGGGSKSFAKDAFGGMAGGVAGGGDFDALDDFM